VAAASRAIAENPDKIFDYTMKGNAVAVITDGSSVLGLGNIGPEAALPVMEGKALLFKEFSGIDAIPLCIQGKTTEEKIITIKNIAPMFGGINLEDIKAPECFEIENALQDLGIPVMHDDQHGTAIVVLAGLLNALQVVRKKKEYVKIVISGAGAAGIAVTKLLIEDGFNRGNIILCDRNGALYEGRKDIEQSYKKEIAQKTNAKRFKGTLKDALNDADVFIGVSGKNLVSKEMVKSMNAQAIVFALANPDPEILPHDAVSAGAFIVASGRSDFPNQINNVLAFPGIFRGALDSKAKKITTEMKLNAAHALASLVKQPTKDMIIPSVFDKNVVKVVSEAVKRAI
jgi:malate dehydrogenase (oxaloacetate-decarboxylating)